VNSSIRNPGFFSKTGRHSKAQKIIKIINEHKDEKNSRLRLLDIGTGNGEIALYLSKYYEVTSVDVTAPPITLYADRFSFIQVTDEHLPFPDNSFDIIISNHVIEHLQNADLHLTEMARILATDGLIYLATPNKLWPWEVHYHIALLHYLPQRLFMFFLKAIGKYHEELWLLSWPTLRKKLNKYFSTIVVSSSVCKWPHKYYLNINNTIAKALSLIPLWLYKLLIFIHPTLIVILKSKPI